MKIGVWQPQRYETSVRIYSENVVQHLRAFGNEIIFFTKNDAIPDADIIWDPTCTGAQYPNRKIMNSNLPWIVTVHGAANLSMPLRFNFPSLAGQLKGLYINSRRKVMWSIYKYKVAHIITVSKYAKEELVEHLNIEPNLISIIYHGYDDTVFFRQSGSKDYLLHVSVYQPKKNVDRVIAAYQSIHDESKLPLLIICPGYPRAINDKKISLITQAVERKQVAKYMKAAHAFIFPSLHESFGMPLLEAMACGVPVITSNTTACPEIIKDAGILVDPHSVESIRDAIIRIREKSVHDEFSQNALERAKDFSWEKTARLHEELFKRFLHTNVN